MGGPSSYSLKSISEGRGLSPGVLVMLLCEHPRLFGKEACSGLPCPPLPGRSAAGKTTRRWEQPASVALGGFLLSPQPLLLCQGSTHFLPVAGGLSCDRVSWWVQQKSRICTSCWKGSGDSSQLLRGNWSGIRFLKSLHVFEHGL